MRSKKNQPLIWSVAACLLFLLLMSADTSPQTGEPQPDAPPALSRTKKALAEQKALVKQLQVNAKELEKDAEDMHRELCP